MKNKKMIIAGPCALESKEQLQACVQVLLRMGIDMLRASLWKPRTKPGWEGMGWSGLHMLLQETLHMLLQETLPHGITPATEIMSADHALMVMNALEEYGPEARAILWLGARNQNHMEQKRIAKVLSTGHKGITLMFKNQVWEDEKHWLGIYEHIISEGYPRERLMICHRGFSPGKMENPQGLRNIPDLEMAMRVKEKTGLKMLLDPSHIGGSVGNVIDVCRKASLYDLDGYLIEMHPDPEHARTDVNQQLSPEKLKEVLDIIDKPSDTRRVA